MSPDNMPSTRLYDGDMKLLMNYLRSMNDKIVTLESAMAAMSGELRTLQEWPTLARSSGTSQRDQQLTGAQGQSTVMTHGNSVTAVTTAVAPRSADLPGTSLDWASAYTSTPVTNTNRFAMLQSADDDHDHTDRE